MTDLVSLPPPSVMAPREQLRTFTNEWLRNRRLSDHTRRAYHHDVDQWIDWCGDQMIPPLAAKFTHVNTYARHLEETAKLSARTVARALSSISSWYGFLVKLEAVRVNPAALADRPRVDRMETATIGFTAVEARGMVAEAQTDRWLGDLCAAALAMFLIDIGARVSEVCGAQIEDLGHDSGHRTVKLRMKGGKSRQRSIPPALSRALDSYLADRAETIGARPDELAGALFVTPAGAPLTPRQVARFVRRIAKAAGLPGADRITPHSCRHAWATIAREAGAALETRQHALGHADPRTTQVYDRLKFQLDQDPSYLVVAAVAEVMR